MTTFRAAYFVAVDGQSDVLLTAEDQAHFSDAALIEDAVATAHQVGLIGDDDHQVTEAALRDGLVVGDYTQR